MSAEKNMTSSLMRVSVHGGHSGQFCLHAADSLEDVVRAYIKNGFAWVGLTEHMPSSEEKIMYPEEKFAGMNVDSLVQRFDRYCKEARRLQEKYRDRITIYVGMETETYDGCSGWIAKLRERFDLDYVVGSVHHLDNLPFDSSIRDYELVARRLGGIDEMYCRYFDEQYAMLKDVKPEVVGHIDLIRIFDDDYETRLQKPRIRDRIERNLDVVQRHGMILDYNLRSLLKGAKEPYVSPSILLLARERNIRVAPGDDSHGIDSIGVNIDSSMKALADLGFSTDWPRPVVQAGGRKG